MNLVWVIYSEGGRIVWFRSGQPDVILTLQEPQAENFFYTLKLQVLVQETRKGHVSHIVDLCNGKLYNSSVFILL
jgi:hypothetical protein